ncbi:MAG: GerMN domain-containing protein [Actinobacteria bacterium]|nr:GerMN domain-containing protein [Actinomycetota bacterium]
MKLSRHTRSLALRTAALGLGLGLLTGCGDDDTEPVAADPQPTAVETTPATPPATDPEPSEPAPTEPDPTATVAAPVYFVGDSPTGPRLYREFREVSADAPLMDGAALLVTGDALDPDYSTLLPPLGITSIEVTDDAIVVALGADSVTADKATSPADAALAVQSLVYTLQGIAQTRLPVQVVQGDQPVALLGQPTDAGVKASPQLEVLSLVNVTTPTSEAALSGTFTASGVASSFEATVLWEVRDGSDSAVLDGFATAEGFLDKLYPWETEVDVSSLEPGDYTFVALTDDPSAGEGPGPYEDSKAITVG